MVKTKELPAYPSSNPTKRLKPTGISECGPPDFVLKGTFDPEKGKVKELVASHATTQLQQLNEIRTIIDKERSLISQLDKDFEAGDILWASEIYLLHRVTDNYLKIYNRVHSKLDAIVPSNNMTDAFQHSYVTSFRIIKALDHLWNLIFEFESRDVPYISSHDELAKSLKIAIDDLNFLNVFIQYS